MTETPYRPPGEIVPLIRPGSPHGQAKTEPELRLRPAWGVIALLVLVALCRPS